MNAKTPETLKRKRRKHVVRKIILIFLLLMVLAGAAFYAWSSLKQEYTVTYDPYTATIGSISNALSFNGSLQVVDSKNYTADGNATVRNIYVSLGQDVKKGEKLIRLSNGTTLTADFDGRVNSIDAAKDDEVKSGDQLLQLVDFTHMKVSVRIDEYDIASVAPGDRCVITATATEKRFESVIDNINYVSSSGGNVAYYTGTIYADVSDGVYPGMQVTVSVPQEEATDVVILKVDALSFDRTNTAFVYIMDEKGAMAQKTVEVGVSNGNYVEIRSGVNDGDTVYAVAKNDAANAMEAMFRNMFGSQQINNGRGNFGGGFGGGNFGGGNSGGSGGNRTRNSNGGGSR